VSQRKEADRFCTFTERTSSSPIFRPATLISSWISEANWLAASLTLSARTCPALVSTFWTERWNALGGHPKPTIEGHLKTDQW
jgi:hypothetical protein